MRQQQIERMRHGPGFIAALDQSGGSTPGALRRYGIDESAYRDKEQMFELIHQLRSRIITSPAFTDDQILGAILFERTMDREIGGKPAAAYLWEVKGVVPFLKVDRGLEAEVDGVRLMRPITDLDALLARATANGVFGTKMRSLVVAADPAGIDALVGQQLDLADRILAAGLVPIVEPEVDIHSSTKPEAEELVAAALRTGLDALAPDQSVVLKLTLPERDGLYTHLVAHPRVLRVAALSGGYSRAEACARLARNPGVIASFSRALTEGLTAQQRDPQFDATLAASIHAIYVASTT